MTVFKLVPVAVAVLAATAPNVAAARPHGEVSRQLADPRMQDAIGEMMGAMMEVLLDMPAEPLARMADAAGNRDTARSIPRGATVGDLAGPEARHLPREMRRRAPAMVGAMGGMAEVLEDAAPQFEKIGRDFEERMKQAQRRSGRSDED